MPLYYKSDMILKQVYSILDVLPFSPLAPVTFVVAVFELSVF